MGGAPGASRIVLAPPPGMSSAWAATKVVEPVHEHVVVVNEKVEHGPRHARRDGGRHGDVLSVAGRVDSDPSARWRRQQESRPGLFRDFSECLLESALVLGA